MTTQRIMTLLAIAAASTGPAGANGVAEVYILQNIIGAPVIEVRSDVTGYTATATSSLTYELTIGGHCAPHFWLDSTKVNIRRLSTEADWFAYYDVLGQNADAPQIFEDSFEKSRNLTGPEKLNAAGLCRRFFDEQRAAGKSTAWILSRDHYIPGPTLFKATHSLTCNRHGNLDDRSKSIDLENSLLCKKAPFVTPGSMTQPPRPPGVPGPGDMTQRFGVTRAEVDVDPDRATVVSRADLTVRAEIETNGPGRVRYRLVHNGEESEVGSLQFSKAKTWRHSWPLPVRCNQPPAGGGGGGGMAANPPNVRTGTVRLEILAPASGVRASEEAAYTVTCRKSGNLAVPLPDLVLLEAKLNESRAALRVHNRGVAGSPANRLRATRAGALASYAAVPALAAGAEKVVEIDLPPGNPNAPITFKIDPGGSVRESDETNNELVH
jgi:hypothetical protein